MSDESESVVVVGFSLHDLGWADVSLQIGPDVYTIASASYTTDALGDLVRFALMLVVGGVAAECSFDLEPTEMRLRGVSDGVTVHLSVYGFDSIHLDRPIEAGAREFYATCRVVDLGRAVALAADAVLSQEGGTGFKARWTEDFPTRALVALKAALGTVAS